MELLTRAESQRNAEVSQNCFLLRKEYEEKTALAVSVFSASLREIKKESKNENFWAKYLQDSQKSDNFAAEIEINEIYVNVECILLRLLLLLYKQL